METRPGTAFIVDLRNSTRLYKYNKRARKLLPVMLKDIFEHSLKIILSVEPSFENRYFNDTGDGFICGLTGEKHLIKALYCASRIRYELFKIRKKYNKKLGTTVYTGLDFGIGLYRGRITEIDYRYTTPDGKLIRKKTLIGNACNIASRLESYSHFQQKRMDDPQEFKKFKDCRLITTENTLKMLGANIDKNLLIFKELGFLPIKGLDGKFQMVALKSGIHKILKDFL